MVEQHWLSSSTQNPQALESIQNLEASKRLPLQEDDDQGIFAPPIFVEHMNNVSCSGGETAHFVCKVEPKNDPSLELSKFDTIFRHNKHQISFSAISPQTVYSHTFLKTAWNLNEKPLSSGSRIIPRMDFGAVILDVKGVNHRLGEGKWSKTG